MDGLMQSAQAAVEERLTAAGKAAGQRRVEVGPEQVRLTFAGSGLDAREVMQAIEGAVHHNSNPLLGALMVFWLGWEMRGRAES